MAAVIAAIPESCKAGATALIIASRQGHADVVERLLRTTGDYPAYVDAANNSGYTALIYACWPGAGVRAGADVSAATNADRKFDRTVKRLLSAGAGVNAAANDGTTALFAACKGREADIVKDLLSAGADVNRASKYGKTALFAACKRGEVGIVKDLLAAGAEVNAADIFGSTALLAACERGEAGIVKDLLAAGAEVNAADRNGNTALLVACERGEVGIVKDLLAAGAEVNAADGTAKLLS
ncbi:hypothetical protein DIPPA_24758 [Diplonema papillatum]|nr:hypothetical protein DIPPA_24758 [Diplonema papillatum]